MSPSVQPKVPKELVSVVLVLCTLPPLLNLFGVDFSTGYSREFVHTILEWSSFCIALFTVVLAFTHYYITRDVTTPIIGTAIFFSGMMDAFQILAADGLIGTVADREDFVPFTWAFSRTFNVCILIAGTAPFLWKGETGNSHSRQRGMPFIVYTGMLFGAAAYAIIYICSQLELPNTVYPNRVVPRPWDSIPLILYIFGGGVIFPRFHRLRSNVFSHSLMISVFPLVAAQFYVAFGSTKLYDNNFNVACYLKIIAYAVPLAGLILDYKRAYRTEVTLRTTEEKLRVARDVHQRLLPKASPKLPGYDMAGFSYSADDVGGDFFDYLQMKDGQLGLVVADVSGHEIGASIFMAQTRAYLRALALTYDRLDEMITHVNRLIVRDVQSRSFVTLFFVQLNPEPGTFYYSANGHEAHLFDSAGTVTTFQSTSPPLGVLEDGPIACGPETQMGIGDVLLLVTDGVVEAKSPTGEQFGLKRVFETVKINHDRSARQIADAMFRALTTFRETVPLADDITLVVLKRKELS